MHKWSRRFDQAVTLEMLYNSQGQYLRTSTFDTSKDSIQRFICVPSDSKGEIWRTF